MRVNRKIVMLGSVAGAMLAGAALAQDATQLWSLEGLNGPESVAWDAASGTVYVSLMGADPMAKDGDGAIGTLAADGTLIAADWVTGLDAPKGIGLAEGRLFTADIDQLVEIDTATGEVVARYPAEGAMLLNDVVVAPDGRVFVSDTFTMTIWVLADGSFTPWLQDPALMGANGLIVADGALIVANLGDVSQGFENAKPGWVVSVDLETQAVTNYGAADAVGLLDGIASDGAGGVLFTDYISGRIMRQAPGGAAAPVGMLSLGSADMDYDPAGGVIFVPITPEGRVVALSWRP